MIGLQNAALGLRDYRLRRPPELLQNCQKRLSSRQTHIEMYDTWVVMPGHNNM